MSELKGFLSKYNISTHSLAVIAVALAAAYNEYKPFHDQVQKWHAQLPPLLQMLVGLAGFIYALYKTGALKGSGDDQKPANGPDVVRLGLVLLMMALLGGMLLWPAVCAAQATDPGPRNIYAAGLSYSVNGSPAVAGTALYAHLLNSSGTYAFTAIDAVPNTVKPFTVTTNTGVGVAQKVFTIGSTPLYMPTAAGISWSGTHTGWQWNGGVLAAIHLKNGYSLMPSVRFLKSSVSEGSGYQPIFGVLFGWGK